MAIKRLLSVFLGIALVAAVSGCGGDSKSDEATASRPSSTTSAAAPAPAAKPAATGKTVKTVSSNYGKVVADTTGEALYLFTKDKGSKSKCYGACAKAWPPLITKGDPRAGKGVTASKLGTTKRKDGKLQVTYNGHPLYYYRDDSPGKILCQAVNEFGGGWYVVAPSGKKIS